MVPPDPPLERWPETTIGARFLAVTSARPDAIAVWTPTTPWSYSRLAEAANLYARQLAGGASPVALGFSRGPELIAAMLGCALADRVWAVLNPTAPPKLRAAMLSSLGPHDHLDATGLIPAAPSRAAAMPAGTSSFCLTSGSTASPRCVVHAHAATLENVRHGSASLGITPEDRCLWLSAPWSAASESAIFYPLFNGACVLPFEVGEQGLSALAAWIAQARATVHHSIPSVFRALVRGVPHAGMLSSLRVVKLGGEPLFGADARLFRTRLGNQIKIVNALGLAEANGNVCHDAVSAADPVDGPAPVGHVLPGFRVTLHDPAGTPVAPGQSGRIRLSGSALALGYWSSPQGGMLPFAPSVAGGREFQTEDQGRFLNDGRLLHLGRTDDVIKIRGVQVSRARVEAALRHLPGVSEAAVGPCRDTHHETRLVAWIEPSPGARVETNVLRRALAAQLEAEAVPRDITLLPALPRLPGGKIDHQALAAARAQAMPPREDRPVRGDAPGPTALARLFADSLGLADYDINQSFFAGGGDSLAAASLALAIERAYGVTLHPAALAEHPSPSLLWPRLREQIPAPALLLASGSVDSRGPVWLFGGAGNVAFELQPLARRLVPWGPVYGFEALRLEPGRWPCRVEDMVATMLPAMRSLQPHGPYRLAGTSFGGLLAFEVAHQLRDDGHEVAFLGMLDAYGPGYPTLVSPPGLGGYRRLVMAKLLRNYPRLLRFRPRQLHRSLGVLGSRLIDRFRIRHFPMPPINDPRRRVLLAAEACLIAKRRYHYRRLDVAITTFAAEFYDHGLFVRSRELGWAPWSTRPIHGFLTPGMHGDHLQPPNVDTLAQLMLAALDQTGRGASSPPGFFIRDHP